jgi:hypothetical protein
MHEVCSIHGEREKCIKILVGKSERTRALERPRRRWGDDINMTVKEIEWTDVE